MNKSQLVDALAARLGDRRTAASAVDALLEIIVDTVGSGGSVALTGFGVFEARARAPRVARNPRTGETVDVPATTVPAFRPGTAFKSLVSGNGVSTRPAPARRSRRTPVAAAEAAPKTKPARSSGKAKASAPFSETEPAEASATKAAPKTAAKTTAKTTSKKAAKPAPKTAAKSAAKASGKSAAEDTAKPTRRTAKTKK